MKISSLNTVIQLLCICVVSFGLVIPSYADDDKAATVKATTAQQGKSQQGNAEECKDKQGNAKHCDQRGVIQIRAHAGVAIDNFAADNTKTYLNYNDTNTNKSRGIFGFDMAYRLVGDANKRLQNGWTNQLWLYGSTVHGMRSAEVDCDAHPQLSICSNKLATTPNPNDNIYMLRNASSLEATAGFRYEFITLQADSGNAANVYINAQAGFLTVANNGGDVVDMHQAGIGAVVVNGSFRNSFFEVGWGKSDVFLSHRSRRLKVVAYAEYTPKKVTKDTVSVFAKMVADTDLGSGADSIQSYVGVSFNFDSALVGGSSDKKSPTSSSTN